MRTLWLFALNFLILLPACKKKTYIAALEPEAYAWLKTPAIPFQYANQSGDTLTVSSIDESEGGFQIAIPEGSDADMASAERFTRKMNIGTDFKVEMVVYGDAPTVSTRKNLFFYDFYRNQPTGFTSTGGEAWPADTLFDPKLDSVVLNGTTITDVYHHAFPGNDLELFIKKGIGLVGFKSGSDSFALLP